ncbi:hypothetical protein M3Y96_01196700 [Aphelenchoides besseyi]|nr:hypothetical protein M3Y96_01196700 [Aphelenchoides besseyi]
MTVRRVIILLSCFLGLNVNAAKFFQREQRAINAKYAFKSLGSMDEELKVAELIPNTHTSHLNISFDELFEKYEKVKVNAQNEVEHLDGIQIAAPAISKNANAERYSKMVDLLHRITPHLDTVTLIGSHMYKPSNENRPEVVKEEIIYVRTFLKQMIAAFTKHNIRVESIRYVVGIVVPDKIRTQVDFGRLITETFGYQPMQDELEHKAVGMVLQIDKVTVYLGVGVNPSHKDDSIMTPTSIIPTGRSDFLHQALLTNFRKEWYAKILDLIQLEPSTVLRHRVNALSRKFFNSATDDRTIKATDRTMFESKSQMDYMEFEHPPQLQLEDFYDKHIDNIRSEANLERLGLKVTVQNRSDVTIAELYEKAVNNLRQVAPNLRSVNLIGGYSRESITRELEFVSATVRQWISSFESQNIAVEDVRYVAHLVVPSKIRETSGYLQTIKRVFNYQPTTVEIEHKAVRMRLEFNKVPVRLAVHFSDLTAGDNQDFCLPMEQMERQPLFYYACPEKRASQQWYKSVWTNATFNW